MSKILFCVTFLLLIFLVQSEETNLLSARPLARGRRGGRKTAGTKPKKIRVGRKAAGRKRPTRGKRPGRGRRPQRGKKGAFGTQNRQMNKMIQNAQQRLQRQAKGMQQQGQQQQANLQNAANELQQQAMNEENMIVDAEANLENQAENLQNEENAFGEVANAIEGGLEQGSENLEGAMENEAERENWVANEENRLVGMANQEGIQQQINLNAVQGLANQQHGMKNFHNMNGQQQFQLEGQTEGLLSHEGLVNQNLLRGQVGMAEEMNGKFSRLANEQSELAEQLGHNRDGKQRDIDRVLGDVSSVEGEMGDDARNGRLEDELSLGSGRPDHLGDINDEVALETRDNNRDTRLKRRKASRLAKKQGAMNSKDNKLFKRDRNNLRETSKKEKNMLRRKKKEKMLRSMGTRDRKLLRRKENREKKKIEGLEEKEESKAGAQQRNRFSKLQRKEQSKVEGHERNLERGVRKLTRAEEMRAEKNLKERKQKGESQRSAKKLVNELQLSERDHAIKRLMSGLQSLQKTQLDRLSREWSNWFELQQKDNEADIEYYKELNSGLVNKVQRLTAKLQKIKAL